MKVAKIGTGDANIKQGQNECDSKHFLLCAKNGIRIFNITRAKVLMTEKLSETFFFIKRKRGPLNLAKFRQLVQPVNFLQTFHFNQFSSSGES